MLLFDAASPTAGFPVIDKICQQGNIAETMHEIRNLLDEDKVTPTALGAWLSGLSHEELTLLWSRSVERSSHFKWFLGDNTDGYIIWLHEYKAAQLPDTVGSFAASVHNHRYSFVSQVLTGSLQVSDFELDSAQQLPVPSEKRTIGAQNTYFLSSERVHRIDATAAGTCTLVVQGPPERPYSRVFDLTSGTFRDMHDLPSRFPELISLLSESGA